MNLSEFIDELIALESSMQKNSVRDKVELPVYAVNAISGAGNLIAGAFIAEKHTDSTGELCRLSDGENYVEIIIL